MVLVQLLGAERRPRGFRWVRSTAGGVRSATSTALVSTEYEGSELGVGKNGVAGGSTEYGCRVSIAP
jgi:hypothetical protein